MVPADGDVVLTSSAMSSNSTGPTNTGPTGILPVGAWETGATDVSSVGAWAISSQLVSAGDKTMTLLGHFRRARCPSAQRVSPRRARCPSAQRASPALATPRTISEVGDPMRFFWPGRLFFKALESPRPRFSTLSSSHGSSAASSPWTRGRQSIARRGAELPHSPRTKRMCDEANGRSLPASCGPRPPSSSRLMA